MGISLVWIANWVGVKRKVHMKDIRCHLRSDNSSVVHKDCIHLYHNPGTPKSFRNHGNLYSRVGYERDDRKEESGNIKMIMNSCHIISRGARVRFKLWKQVGEIELFHVEYIPAIIEADIS